MSELLIEIIKKKETILVLSLDVVKKEKFFKILKKCAPYICALKLHLDIYPFMTSRVLKRIIKISKKYNFIIIEDRKFSDIGNTQRLQAEALLKKGITYFTSHIFTGEKALRSLPIESKIFLVSDMSCEDAFFSDIDNLNLKKEMHKKSCEYYESIHQVIGFVSQYRININSGRIPFILRPGIRLSAKTKNKDRMGQNYNYPMVDSGVCWVVGREICEAESPEVIAKQYKNIFKAQKYLWFKNETSHITAV